MVTVQPPLPTPPAGRIPKLESVQMLRGIAALLVVLFHLCAFQVEGEALFGGVPILDRGFAGVDMFFVISGFIMVWVTRTDQSRMGAFLYSRASRIYPLWWVYAGLATIWLLATGGTAAGDYLAKSFALMPQSSAPVLEVGWTLIHEMYFYAVFALLILLPRERLGEGLLVWASAITLCTLTLSAPPLASNVVELVASPLTFEFLMGAGLALLLERGRRMSVAVAIGELAIGIVCLVGAALLAPDAWFALHPNMAKVLLFGVPCALIVDGCVGLERAGHYSRRLWAKTGSWLGNASYSLYLCHLFVLAAGGKAFALAFSVTGLGLFDLASGALLPRLLFAVGAVVACVIVAEMSYRWIERPLGRLFRRLRPRKPVPSLPSPA